MFKVKRLRLFRISTGSWITYQLPCKMSFNLAVVHIKLDMPGWAVIRGTASNR